MSMLPLRVSVREWLRKEDEGGERADVDAEREGGGRGIESGGLKAEASGGGSTHIEVEDDGVDRNTKGLWKLTMEGVRVKGTVQLSATSLGLSCIEAGAIPTAMIAHELGGSSRPLALFYQSLVSGQHELGLVLAI